MGRASEVSPSSAAGEAVSRTSCVPGPPMNPYAETSLPQAHPTPAERDTSTDKLSYDYKQRETDG